MRQTRADDALREFLTVGEAARLLGVCVATLRNWDRAGKLKPARHPINSYRLYRREDLAALPRQGRPASTQHLAEG